TNPPSSRSAFGWHELESQCTGLGFQPLLYALCVPLFVSSENALVICLTGSEEVINDAGEFVGSSSDGLWRAQFCAHASIELADGTVAVVEGVRGEAKRFRGTVSDLSSTCP